MTQTTTNQIIRPAREYSIYLEAEGGGDATMTTIIDAGTEAQQDAEAETWADAEADDWMRDGEWGDDGASVTCYITMSDDDSEWQRRSISVEIEPCHAALITAATRGYETCGDDTDDHDWTSEGEGGCDENPGVWATGGTSMVFHSHCRRCGLRRTENVTGSQRNPGEHDTVRYEMPDED